MTTTLDPLQTFRWTPQPQAETLIHSVVDDFLQGCPTAAAFAARMRDETGTRFFDWIDHIQMPAERAPLDAFLAAGFACEPQAAMPILHHPAAIFPRLVLSAGEVTRVALKVESAADFLVANRLERPIDGIPFAPIRQAGVAAENSCELRIIERHGDAGFTEAPADAGRSVASLEHLERFRVRRRLFPTEAEGFGHLGLLVEDAVAALGPDAAAAFFFTAEREYWQRRNNAARVQKMRQDRLGLGWANHDHHTYRSSRRHFQSLIALFETLGLECRERFYAGREAGWGAQVMENPNAGIVVFADVDLAPEELSDDFAHQPLSPQPRLGTVGLWCALHGEAILQAGMHHLECQFDFAALTAQLESRHIPVMKPFTDFPHLKQAFTQGERWAVAPERITPLLDAGLITAEQAAQFQSQGAIGSHLENLERNAGYKGFNQTGVSEIITATDPRKNLQGGA